MIDPMREQKSFSELIAELTRESTLLFRQELALVKAELSQKASLARAGAAELAAGGLIVFLAAQALLAAAIMGLADAIGWWQAALAIGGVVLLVGVAVVFRGLSNLKAERLAPRRSQASLKENGEWAKERMR